MALGESKEPEGFDAQAERRLLHTYMARLSAAAGDRDAHGAAAFGAGALSGDTASVETVEGAAASDQRSFSAPVYDGRGKWSGY